MKVLNLYAGIGGNRKLWKDVEVTAIENNESIAKIYQDFFPKDKVIVADAHQYLLEHYKEFDFIWSSPPCPTHSIMNFLHNEQSDKGIKMRYPNMKLYEEIIFLKHWFKGKWIVENVISYYKPLIKPFESGGHYFWSNGIISKKKRLKRGIRENIDFVSNKVGFNLDKYKLSNKRQLLNNCVEPELALHVFNCIFNEIQQKINLIKK